MPYITAKRKIIERQVTWLDLLMGDGDEGRRMDPTGTITCFVENLKPEILKQTDVAHLEYVLQEFCEKYNDVLTSDIDSRYSRFYIPKSTGGLRTIDAPDDRLKEAQTELVRIFHDDFGALYHTSAFGYVTGRCPKKAVERHMNNESNWYLKLDFHDFFGSITKEYVMRVLSMLYPFNLLVEWNEEILSRALDVCFLHGSFPQGSTASPFLSNVIMIPIDHRLYNDLAKRHMVYTRYVDDIEISCVQSFRFKEIVDHINAVLKEFGAPFGLNEKKTHYGNRNGQNWVLGLMVNKDNNITVGYQKKKQFKAMINSFILDQIHGVKWSYDDLNHFAGLLSYYTSIEPDYFRYLIKHYNEKYKVNFKIMLKKARFM